MPALVRCDPDSHVTAVVLCIVMHVQLLPIPNRSTQAHRKMRSPPFKNSGFFFESPAWQACNFTVKELRHVWRQVRRKSRVGRALSQPLTDCGLVATAGADTSPG